MKLTDFFLAQLARETPISRRVLQRVPEGKPDWKPHEKIHADGIPGRPGCDNTFVDRHGR